MGDPTPMDLMQQQLNDMAKKSEERMSRLEELLNKLVEKPTSSQGESAPLDENGNPIAPSKDPENSTNKDKPEFSYLYNNSPNVQLPHINNLGKPPLVDRARFTNWKASMKSHMCSSSMQIWRVVEKGFYPKDLENLTSSEVIDQQLDANAMHMLENAMVNEGVEHIRALPNAKAAWDYILAMYDGNTSMQRSRKSALQRQVDHFIMKEGESPDDVHRRLKALVVDMIDVGFKDCDDDWIKGKLLQTLIPYNQNMVQNIQTRTDYMDLTPNDIVGCFVTMNMLKESSDDVLARVNGMKRVSLALKATPYEEESNDDGALTYVPSEKEKWQSHNECLALAQHNWWKKGDFRSNATKNKGRESSSMKKARTCFNCGDSEHFVAECPFKSRIENGGRLIKKNNFAPKNKNFMKKVPQKAMMANEQEYLSGGEESEDESEQVGMAAVAMGVIPSSLDSLFSKPNDLKGPTKHKCLMAKGTTPKVISPLIPSNMCSPSLLDCVENLEDKNAIRLSKLMKSFEGEHKIAFDALMSQLGNANRTIDEHEDKIIELEGFARDDANRIAELEEALDKSLCLNDAITETFSLDLSKMMSDRDHALSKLEEYLGENENLNNGHNVLLKNFEQLEKTHKALSSELKALKESHDISQKKNINDNACATNPLCVKALLIEENNRLKTQLEKGLVSCIQGEKNLNELLRNQKKVVGKQGLGFGTEKAIEKKKSTPSTNAIVFVKEGELANDEDEFDALAKSMVSKKTSSHNNFAGKYNPSYVLLKSKNGHVFAKYVGKSYGSDYHHAIWVPKTLVTNKKGPMRTWVPKTKA